MSKTVITLDNSSTGMTVRSPKLPAEKEGPPPWRAFNEFVRNAEYVYECVDGWNELRISPKPDEDYRTSGDIEDEAQSCKEVVAKCKVGIERFDRADNYEDGALKHSHIAKRLGVMIASFPNANPHAPDGYARMLVEHVGAIEDLTDIALESACREIVETQKFAPAISEVVKVIGKHIEQWERRRWAIEHAERVGKLTIETLTKREEEEAKQEHEREVREATYETKRAIETTQRLAKEIETAKTALAGLMRRHAEAEKRESELMRALRKLTAPPEEAEAEAAAANGIDSGQPRLT
jgi:hypothetical protein